MGGVVCGSILDLLSKDGYAVTVGCMLGEFWELELEYMEGTTK